MSQQSLNIQEISSRTFNNDYSMMETSIEPIEKSSPYQFNKGEQRGKKHDLEEICKLQQREIEQYKKTLMDYVNRFQGMDKSKLYKESYEIQIKESLQALQEKERKYRELEERYKEAISGLSETIQKNRMLSSEVARLSRKLQESDLNYSREQQTIHRSQQLLSNMTIAKSSYEIQLVNMQDSLVILELEKKEIEKTNEEYEDKLALIAQEVERLRNQLDSTRRDNEQLKKKVMEQADFLLKFDLQNKELRGSLERMRMESRELRVVSENQTLQLKQYYQKVVYKETIISDYQERQAKVTSLLRDRETQLAELDIKFKQVTHRLEEESGNRKSESASNRELTKQLGRLRNILNESSQSTRQIQLDRQQILKENETISKHLQSMGGELEATIKEKDGLIRDQQALLLKLENAEKQIDLLAKERDSLSRQRQKLLINLQQYNQSLNKMIEERGKETDGSKRAVQERTQQLINQFNSKMEIFSQQKQAQITAKIAEIETLKKELNFKNNECGEYRSELSTRNSELNHAKQEKVSQSSIFDSSRRDYEQKLKQKNDIITELKGKLINLEKLIQQNRRERDLIFQQKNSVVIQTHKTEQLIELKNSDLRNRDAKLEEQARRIKEMQVFADENTKEIENYKRIISDCEQHIRELNIQAQRGNSMAIEIEKLSQLLREREGQINELTVRLRETTHVMEEKKAELGSLRVNNEKMSMSLSRVEESKNNFQLFLKEIDRLNHLVTRKETEITTLKQQLTHLIAKIDSLAQQQLKIVKILEGSLVHDERREDQLNSYFMDLKQYLHSLNSETNNNLKELAHHNASVSNEIARRDERRQQQIENKLEAAQIQLGRREKQILGLQQQYNSALIKLQEYEQSTVQQQQIFEKLLELTRENASLRQQLTHHQHSQQTRDNSLLTLETKVKQAEQELELARREMDQIKIVWGRERQQLIVQLREREAVIKEAKLVRQELERKVSTVSQVIDRKVKDFESMATIIASNTKEMERYRETIKSYELRQPSQPEGKQVDSYLTQIDKLKQIVEIRTAQQAMNEENYRKLTIKLQKAEKQASQFKHEKSDSQQLQERCQQLEYQIKQLQQDLHELQLKNSQSEAYIAQITTQHKHDQTATQDLSALKSHIHHLQTELSSLYSRIREGQNKLIRADRQIQQLQNELHAMLQANAHAIDQLQILESIEMDKQQLQQNYSAMEEELESVRGMMRQMEIENRYMRGSQQQSKIFLHTYEYKTAQLEKEYVKLKQVLNSINLENSKLQTKNHFFEIQLNKADILQQKIQVLNAEINRLARENIDLNEEISTCKLALSEENSFQRRAEEQLVLSVLLMAEIESLRNRVRQQEEELKRSHVQQLSKYRS